MGRDTARNASDTAHESAMPRPAMLTRSMSRLRYEYFAVGGLAAGRYGIEFDAVVRHLWHIRCDRGQRIVIDDVQNLDDVVHAIACTQHVQLAWSDLFERYEPFLVRRCAERCGDTSAVLVVRRMLTALRDDPEIEISHPSRLSGFVGDEPLRTWLADRVHAEIGPRHSVWCAPTSLTNAGPGLRIGPPVATVSWVGTDPTPQSLPFPANGRFR
ncbi:MAG: hypothetical protein ACYTGC_11015 [Planctomycetota bacterium]|jgi:hypothetical protein